MIQQTYDMTTKLNESKTALQLDREIHRLVALCNMYGYEVSRLRKNGDADVFESVKKRVKPVWDSFNEKARLWQRATGVQWVRKSEQPWFDEGELIAWYRENGAKFLVDHINGKTIDDYLREKSRVSRTRVKFVDSRVAVMS